MTKRIVVLVPLRIDNLHRQFLWDSTVDYVNKLGLPIYTADSDGPWSRARAINKASVQAGPWDVAIIADADTVPDQEGISRSIDRAHETRGTVRPHNARRMLTLAGTIKFLRRGPSDLKREDFDKYDKQGGGLITVHRECWNELAGFNEDFVEWGHEDSEFNFRCIRHRSFDIVPGTVYHLWHPRPVQDLNLFKYRQLIEEYRLDVAQWQANHPERTYI